MLPGDIWRAQGALGGYDSSMVVDEMNVVAIERLRMTGFFFLTSHTSTLMGQCSSNIRSTPAFSTSKCAQEQGLCIDVGIDLWLYAGLSRNKHVKDATTFTVTLRSISRYHIFDKNW